MNKGKNFEHDFRDSAKKQGIWIMRINDTYYRAKQNDANAFVPQQVCDYLLHYNNEIFLVELKSTKEKYITIEREKNGMIKKHQYEQMSKLEGEHEHGVLVLQFENTGEQKTYAMPIKCFMKFLSEKSKSSINELEVVQYGGVNIEQKLMRVNWAYNIKGFVERRALWQD